MIKAFSNLYGFIRFALMLIIALWVFKVIMIIHKQFDSAIPEYTTQHFYKPEYRPEPDTKIRGLERITQEKVEPIVVYDTVYYDSSYTSMMRSVKADGKHITIQTQFCGDTTGSEWIYPYVKRFQVVVLGNKLDFTHDKDFFRWTGLSFGWIWGQEAAGKGLITSGIEYVPWRVQGVVYIATDGEIGFIVGKKLW